MMTKILVIDDDSNICELLRMYLEKEGYDVVAAGTIEDTKASFLKENFNLIILDVMLPDGNGFDMCGFIRSKNEDVPILFLTACDDEVQVVRGLDAGADDYVTKPFKLLELLSRIRALLRRNKSTVYSCDNIVIDINTMTVKKDGENVFVTPTEFQILSALIRNSGVIVTRAILLENIWDEGGSFIDDNTLSVHISRLREKIGPEHIVTVRGIGYRWEDGK